MVIMSYIRWDPLAAGRCRRCPYCPRTASSASSSAAAAIAAASYDIDTISHQKTAKQFIINVIHSFVDELYCSRAMVMLDRI